jgi:hypothetical protein
MLPPLEKPTAKVIVAVYEPPQPGLPHLGVIIDESGKVSAVGFETAEEADTYAERVAKTIVAAATESESA